MNKYDEEVQNALSALKNRKNGVEVIYTDTPILFTASQMKNYTPPRYHEMKKLAGSRAAALKSSEWLFYTQARLMEDFTDDYDFRGSFSRFYPTYADMTTEQLRGYFSWRTRVRQGIVQKTAPGFVFIYIFELLNGIGWQDAGQGYDLLCEFEKRYGEADPTVRLGVYLPRWKKDFILYYGLDTALIEEKSGDEMKNAAVKLAGGEITRKERFDCLNLLSSHKLYKSPVYAKTPEDMMEVVDRVYAATEAFFGGRERAFDLFGSFSNGVYAMFLSAVFHDEKQHKNQIIAVSERERFECNDGMWTHSEFLLSGGKLKTLSGVMKNIDSEMRVRTGCKRKLSRVQTAGFFEDAVRNAVDGFFEEKERLSRPVINIDVSVLDSIRKTAEITQQKLIVDEELPQDEQSMPEPVPVQPQPGGDIPLDGQEAKVLEILLSGEDAEEYCRKNGLMLSVVCDAINEKLFDLFSDNVIEYFDCPVIIEDYGDELKNMMGVG